MTGVGSKAAAQAPWGSCPPIGLERPLIELCRRLPANWLGARLAVLLRHPVKYGPETPLDVVVWGLKLRLSRRGNYSETALLFRPEAFDPAERDVLRTRIARGMVFLDLGANAGAYSFWVYSQLGGECRIIAVEPDPELFGRLAFNIATNGAASITPVNAALGDRRGRQPLFINRDRRGQNTLLRTPGVSAAVEPVVVDVIPLADLLRDVGVDKVDVMKIDLEGMEYPVLHQFFGTAGRGGGLWPRLLVTEFKATEEHQRLTMELAALGYRTCARTRENLILELA